MLNLLFILWFLVSFSFKISLTGIYFISSVNECILIFSWFSLSFKNPSFCFLWNKSAFLWIKLECLKFRFYFMTEWFFLLDASFKTLFSMQFILFLLIFLTCEILMMVRWVLNSFSSTEKLYYKTKSFLPLFSTEEREKSISSSIFKKYSKRSLNQ